MFLHDVAVACYLRDGAVRQCPIRSFRTRWAWRQVQGASNSSSSLQLFVAMIIFSTRKRSHPPPLRNMDGWDVPGHDHWLSHAPHQRGCGPFVQRLELRPRVGGRVVGGDTGPRAGLDHPAVHVVRTTRVVHVHANMRHVDYCLWHLLPRVWQLVFVFGSRCGRRCDPELVTADP
jgi:hypothetical protein